MRANFTRHSDTAISIKYKTAWDTIENRTFEQRGSYVWELYHEGRARQICKKLAVDQAPVAWRYQTPTGWHATTDAAAANRVSAHHPTEPLYAAPQPQAAELDAQRYRWLRAQPLESDMFCTTIWRKGSDGFGDDLRLEELDAAIDAAIAKATGGAA